MVELGWERHEWGAGMASTGSLLAWVVVRLMKIILKEEGGTLNCELEFSKQSRWKRRVNTVWTRYNEDCA